MSNIIFKSGDIFLEDTKAIVNPVNCFGFSLDGLAEAFKKEFPVNYTNYKKACKTKILTIGTVLVCYDGDQIIINLPTVRKNIFFKSRMSYISSGLDALVDTIKERKIESVAIPALGCGIGGLKWEEVKALMIDRLEPVEECRFVIFNPR